MKFVEQYKKFLNKKIKRKIAIDTLIFLFIWITLTSLLSVDYFPSRPLTVSDVAPIDIAAPRTIMKEDKPATEEAKIKAANKVGIVYKQDPAITENIISDINTTIDTIKKIQALEKENPGTSYVEELNNTPIQLSEETRKTLLATPPEYLNSNIKPNITRIIRDEMVEGLREDSLLIAQKRAKEAAEKIKLPPEYVSAISEIVNKSIKPNIVADLEETFRDQQKAMVAIKPITIEIPKGQIIIRKGEIVTPKHIEILEDLGIYRPNIELKGVAGASILIIIVILIILQYLKQHQPGILQDDKQLFLLCMIIVAIAVVSRWSTKINIFVAPVATASILVTMIMDYRLGLLITAFLSILASIFTENIAPGAVTLITGSVAVLSVSKVIRRSDLITASFIVTITNILSTAVFSLISDETIIDISINSFIWGALNGVFSCLVAIGAMFYIENLFSITTNIKLLELSNPAEPILQRLLIEAPGTYHHSILVGNLAERAAQAVGADPLMARVGALYHDIGKLYRPYLFNENQIGRKNPHDDLTPTLSTLIIIAHVKYGLEFARQYKLPKPITDIIIEHHGTSLVYYFYHQAKMKCPDSTNEADFRYHGPKPRTKEAAIIMIADSIEAAVRQLNQPNLQRIENLINKIIDDIQKDGQLDECELSLKNISDLKKTFINSMKGMYHTRIQYPEKIAKAILDSAKTRSLHLHEFPKTKNKLSQK